MGLNPQMDVMWSNYSRGESFQVVGAEWVEKLRSGPESLRKVKAFHSIGSESHCENVQRHTHQMLRPGVLSPSTTDLSPFLHQLPIPIPTSLYFLSKRGSRIILYLSTTYLEALLFSESLFPLLENVFSN